MTQADAYSNTEGTGGHDHSHDHDEPHVLPLSVYFGVWGALVVLTAITVAVSRFDFGAGNTVIALLVATVKASLVALFFMHLYYDNKLNLIILVASLFFVSIFFTPVLIDLGSRGALDSLKTRAGYKMVMSPPVDEPVAVPASPGMSGAGNPGGDGVHGAATPPSAGGTPGVVGAPTPAGTAVAPSAPAAAAPLGEHAAAPGAAAVPTPGNAPHPAGTGSAAGGGPMGNKALGGGAPSAGQTNPAHP